MRSLTTFDNTFADIFRDLNRFAVGLEPTFRVLDQVRSNAATGYPPYDLEQINDTTYRLSMAVAGFTPDDIEITVHDGVLTIEGRIEKDSGKNYLYKGIAGRSFRRSFYLANWVEVQESNLENGILTLDFKQEIPENMKPRRIEVGSKNSPKVLDSGS